MWLFNVALTIGVSLPGGRDFWVGTVLSPMPLRSLPLGLRPARNPGSVVEIGRLTRGGVLQGEEHRYGNS